MDIHTGEVLAMTCFPQLNPNAAGQVTPERASTARRSASTSWARPTSRSPSRWRWTPGIIKSLGKIYPCPGELHVSGRKIGDTHPFNRPCSVAEIMKESSNVGTAQIADQVGAARQREFLQKMGFLDRVAVELKERGRTLTPRDWSRTDVMTVGFGHSIAVTPLHLAIGYATLFNGGIYRPATLLKVDQDHPVGKGRRVFSEDTSYKMRALASAGRDAGHRARRPTRPAIASAARPAPPTRSSAAAIPTAW